jgi:hypothetical protein
VVGLISYSIIVGGQFKCMLHAAERHGARWFMFLCIACLFLGPAFQMASGIASWQTFQELKANPARLRDVQLNPLGQWLQLIGFGLSMFYPLFFTLFLRAVAICLRISKLAAFIDIFLVFAAILVAATGFAMYRLPRGGAPMIPLGVAVALGAAWLILLIIYIGLIAFTRVGIHVVMSTVKSPLQM